MNDVNSFLCVNVCMFVCVALVQYNLGCDLLISFVWSIAIIFGLNGIAVCWLAIQTDDD